MSDVGEPPAQPCSEANTALVVAFTGEGHERRFAELAIRALEERISCTFLTLDVAAAELDLEDLASIVTHHRAGRARLICVGYGRAAHIGMQLAHRLVADAVLAVASDSEATLGAELSGVQIHLSDLHPFPQDDATSTPASAEALLFALEHGDWLRDTLFALIAATPPPPAANIFSSLRQRLQHSIEIDADNLHQDADGGVHLRGCVRNHGAFALPAVLDTGHPIRIGARVFDRNGQPTPAMEGRGGLPNGYLAPGDVAPFQIIVPRFDPAKGDCWIEVALVCEGQFWFSDLGFDARRLADRVERDTLPARRDLEPARPVEHSETAAATVRLLYRALLGRETDQQGLDHYAPQLDAGRLDERGLADILISSPEYRHAVKRQVAFEGHTVVRTSGCDFLVPEGAEFVVASTGPEGYAPWVLPYFLDHCRPGAAVLDLGANIGAFSLAAAQHVGGDGIVYAVEAAPLNCRLLAQSIAINGLANVRLMPLGASDTLGHAQAPHQAPTSIKAVEPGEPLIPADFDTHDVVPLIPLDLLHPAMRRIDLMKIDIQGVGQRGVMGVLRLLHQDRPVVFLEYSPGVQKRGNESCHILQIFYDLGYGFEILHRREAREMLVGSDAVVAIDAAWRRQAREGCAHLDLCLHPPIEIGNAPHRMRAGLTREPAFDILEPAPHTAS